MSIKTKAYHMLKKLTSQRFRQRLKGQVGQFRSKFAPLLKMRNGTYDSAELESMLRARLPPDYEILMVHSSISDMQPMYQGNARSLLALLLRLATSERTIAMPAFFFGTAELYNREYYRKNPRFDVRRTPSQMGLLSELFRRWPSVVRSLHPTHSVCALGPLANEMVATHHLSPWPCGPLSPFGIMGRRKTVILGLGTEYFRSLTQVHAMEDTLGDEFPLPRESEVPVHLVLIDQLGNSLQYEMCPPMARRFHLRLERLPTLGGPNIVEEWFFKGTRMYLTSARKVDEAVRAAAVRGQTLYEG